MISSSSADQPCSSSSSSALPCCSSSSSDEAEADICGWPSVNVLETPDRRRMRKNWRSVAIRVDLNKIPESVHQKSTVTYFQRPLPAIISRRYCSTSSPNKRSIGSKKLMNFMANSVDCSPNNSKVTDAQLTSPPPLMRRLRHSPVLRTPKSYNCSQPKHIHLSVSPMSAFFIRQRLNAEDDLCVDSPPKCSSASFSSFSVLRPLNSQNYFGIRFSGEQTPKEVTHNQSQLTDSKCDSKASSTSTATDENSFVAPKRNDATKVNSSANDSGFLDCSTLSSDTVIETPSKGLFTAHTCNGTSLTTSSACLFLDFGQSHPPHHVIHPTSYSTTSSIPEQSYGPLEASILDGILNDLSQWPSTDAKTLRTSPQRRSLLFERKLKALEIGREEETSSGKMQGESPNTVTMSGIPSEMVLEMGEMEQVTSEELRQLLPHLDQHSFQLMFGFSSDQLELTQVAHSFISLHCPKALNGNIRSIGLLNECVTEERVKLD